MLAMFECTFPTEMILVGAVTVVGDDEDGDSVGSLVVVMVVMVVVLLRLSFRDSIPLDCDWNLLNKESPVKQMFVLSVVLLLLLWIALWRDWRSRDWTSWRMDG